ncbi:MULTISPECIES: sugar phosphate isomerase/epimerase [unclassified Microbacterium]|uniref:sugar phosphate isomerase/epimerase family protein n=1 Tax=unclassified Microbacterium TaxID=2609290 RepID=UPI00191F13A6|nr:MULTISPECIES: sugar phosphate isomerase/epimerase family protein [unclassified Microbacterium]QYM63947.1 sugar phosphate isomerase/epimerase [Microbacterium sp. Se5.02b]
MYGRTGTDLVGLPAVKTAGHDTVRVAELLEEHGVRLGYLVHPLSAHPDDAAGWERQLAVLADGVRRAHDLGAGTVYLTSGSSGHLDWERAADLFARRLAPLVQLAGSLDVRLAVENTMSLRSDISFTHTAADAFALAERAGMGVCLDLYCCWQERGLDALVADRTAQIEIVQVSDFVLGTSSFPSRWVPGDADLPMRQLLEQVVRAGYEGIVDAELIGPAIEEEGAESALRRSVSWMRAHIAATPDRQDNQNNRKQS